MNIRELVKATRTYRRFDESVSISREQLLEWIDLGRISASGANRQPLRYILSWQPDTNDLIFPQLRWAAMLPDFGAPPPGQRPSAYIVMLADKENGSGAPVDSGIACQSIRLAAAAAGYASCLFQNILMEKLRTNLNIPDTHEVIMVMAIGRPGETVVLEDAGPSGSVRYYRDEQDRHHVPKRPLDSIVLDFLATEAKTR